jgi:transcriptional regulator with XRE-family HTH domain
MGKVVTLKRKQPLTYPKAYTSAEKLIESVRMYIMRDGRGYKALAIRTGVSTATIGNLATGRTQWPRPKTLFGVLTALNLSITIEYKGARK